MTCQESILSLGSSSDHQATPRNTRSNHGVSCEWNITIHVAAGRPPNGACGSGRMRCTSLPRQMMRSLCRCTAWSRRPPRSARHTWSMGWRCVGRPCSARAACSIQRQRPRRRRAQAADLQAAAAAARCSCRGSPPAGCAAWRGTWQRAARSSEAQKRCAISHLPYRQSWPPAATRNAAGFCSRRHSRLTVELRAVRVVVQQLLLPED